MPDMQKQALPIALAVILIAIGTYVQGSWTERWGRVDSEVINQWVERMDHIPTKFGDWESEEAEKTPEDIKKVAGFSDERHLVFKNQRTGAMVDMVLMCGPARRVSVHTPDKCFKAAGFNLGEQQRQQDVASENMTAEFYTAPFVKEDPDKIERFRVLWTWNDAEGWSAPGMPKVHFAGAPALYKLYLISGMQHTGDKFDDSDAAKFAMEYMPLLTAALFPDQATAAVAPADDAAPATDEKSPNRSIR